MTSTSRHSRARSPHRAAGAPGRGYRRPISLFWWTGKRAYLLFVLRELSSVFVAWFVVFTLLFAWCVSQGAERYERFLDVASHPLLVAVNVVALAFLLLHTVTWFNLTPKAMPLRLPPPLARGPVPRKVPSVVVVAAQWAGFAVVSAIVVWLVVS